MTSRFNDLDAIQGLSADRPAGWLAWGEGPEHTEERMVDP
jgi:hypothetical protein